MRMPQMPVIVSRTNSTKHKARNFENQSVVSLIGSGHEYLKIEYRALANKFGSVKSDYDVEEELSSAFGRLEHEVSDGPDIRVATRPAK
jgi:hypothetical protein